MSESLRYGPEWLICGALWHPCHTPAIRETELCWRVGKGWRVWRHDSAAMAMNYTVFMLFMFLFVRSCYHHHPCEIHTKFDDIVILSDIVQKKVRLCVHNLESGTADPVSYA